MEQTKNQVQAEENITSQCLPLILSEDYSIVLTQPVKKISYFLPAYQNTSVFIRVDVPGRSESIVHINRDGQILYEYSNKSIIGQFAMLTLKQVIVANTKQQTIDIIYLEQQVVRSFKHKFIVGDAHQIKIFTFYHSKLFSIVQIANNCFKLTYYHYSKMQLNEQPVCQFLAPKQQWGLEYNLVKVNNHSKIGWFSKAKQTGVIEIHTWDLQQNPKGSLSVNIVNNSFRNGQNSFYFYIHELWQNEPNIYTLVVSSNSTNDGQLEQVTTSNFILDVQKNIIRRASYKFVNEFGDMWKKEVLDYFPLEQYVAFGTHNPQGTTNPVFYVDNHTEKILFIDRRNEKKNVRYFKPGYEPYAYVEASYKKSKVTNIEVSVKRIANIKQILLHFMLYLNEDFHYDLLQDAMELLL